MVEQENTTNVDVCLQINVYIYKYMCVCSFKDKCDKL